MPKPTFQEVPRDHAKLDAHHMLAFKHAVPWWIRPTLHETPFKIEDFVHDVRGRVQRVMKRSVPQHASAIGNRHVFANALAYRIARDSATRAKSGYGTANLADFLTETCAYAHKMQHFTIPEGDPQFGQYGELRTNTSNGGQISVVRMNAQEKACMQWLGKEGSMHGILEDDELKKYREASEETRFILYAPHYRKKLFDIVNPLSNEQLYEAEWRKECVDVSIEQMHTMRGEVMQQELDALDISDDALDMPVNSLKREVLIPILQDETKKKQLLSYLEFACIQKTEQEKYDDLLELIELWRNIALSLNIAPNERPVIGILQILVHASTGNKESMLRLLGPECSHR